MATKPPTRDDWTAVRDAPDYRRFLSAYLEMRGRSLSDLARATGYGRGFPGDVISGRRRLTERSCRAFESALKIPPQGKRLFRLLVASAEPDLFPDLDPASVARAIGDLRSRPWGRVRGELNLHSGGQTNDILSNSLALGVYAAAGAPGVGATFLEICNRTRASDREIVHTLRQLQEAGLISHREGRYEPTELHLFLRAVDTNTSFTALFRTACQLAAERASAVSTDSEREMFFTSAFCVREESLAELKSELRKTMLKFVDDSIDPNGDRVVRLIAGLHL